MRPPRRVGLNAVFLEPGMGGLETYVVELVPALLAADPALELTIVANDLGRELLGALPWASSVRFVVPAGSRRGLRLLYELGPLGLSAGRDFELLHSPALTAPLLTRATNVVVMADVTWLLVPDLGAGQAPTTRIWQAVVPHVARRADRIIAISADSAAGVQRELRVPAERIDVVGLGHGAPAAGAPRTPPSELTERFGLGDGPLLLSVGAKKRHKNQLRLVQALPEVRAAVDGAQLLLVGAPTPWEDDIRAEAERLGVGEHVRFAGYVERADLEGLYAHADVFAFPSLNEGFGLPVLEAMARDLPVVTSDASSLPEVAGDAAVLVDPESVESIAAGLVRALRDPALRDELVTRGRKRLGTFTWNAAAAGTLESWERAMASRGGRRRLHR